MASPSPIASAIARRNLAAWSPRSTRHLDDTLRQLCPRRRTPDRQRRRRLGYASLPAQPAGGDETLRTRFSHNARRTAPPTRSTGSRRTARRHAHRSADRPAYHVARRSLGRPGRPRPTSLLGLGGDEHVLQRRGSPCRSRRNAAVAAAPRQLTMARFGRPRTGRNSRAFPRLGSAIHARHANLGRALYLRRRRRRGVPAVGWAACLEAVASDLYLPDKHDPVYGIYQFCVASRATEHADESPLTFQAARFDSVTATATPHMTLHGLANGKVAAAHNAVDAVQNLADYPRQPR